MPFEKTQKIINISTKNFQFVAFLEVLSFTKKIVSNFNYLEF